MSDPYAWYDEYLIRHLVFNHKELTQLIRKLEVEKLLKSRY
jgi:hypothetical protein